MAETTADLVGNEIPESWFKDLLWGCKQIDGASTNRWNISMSANRDTKKDLHHQKDEKHSWRTCSHYWPRVCWYHEDQEHDLQ